MMACTQWVEILKSVQRVFRWCDVDAVDPIMASDVALRLARLYESAALLRTSHAPRNDSTGVRYNTVALFIDRH